MRCCSAFFCVDRVLGGLLFLYLALLHHPLPNPRRCRIFLYLDLSWACTSWVAPWPDASFPMYIVSEHSMPNYASWGLRGAPIPASAPPEAWTLLGQTRPLSPDVC